MHVTGPLIPPSGVLRADRRSSLLLWGGLWASLVALGWVLPNHYYPWIAFHTDAWIAWMFLLGSAALLLTSPAPIAWHPPALLAAVLVPVPFLQWLGGVLVFSGQAWITAAYLFGFLLALLAGAHAEKVHREQAIEFLLAAIGMAAICSVGIQLWQWLALDGLELWIVRPADVRPFGNLAQPNQMATFLLWGLLGVAWATWKRHVRPVVGVACAAFLLVGVALTQSRTGIASLVMILVLAFYWRNLWPARSQVAAALAGLAVFYVACLLAIGPASSALGLDKPYSAITRIGGADIRLDVYKMFLDAAWQEPWVGYGWTNLAPAHFAVAERHPGFSGTFNQSHNLFIDFVLWLGIPAGTLVSAAIVIWFAKLFLRVRTPEDAVLLAFVAVVGVHAMLELPLHYAYMLLPTGFVLGVLNMRLMPPAFVVRIGRKGLALVALAATLLLATITRDYLRVEADFLALRFERAYNTPLRSPPDILVLDQLAAFNALGRKAATRGMTDSELESMRYGAEAFPSPSNLYVHTAALALNGRGDEAQKRMRKLSKVLVPSAYEELGRAWRAQSQKNPELALVPWVD